MGVKEFFMNFALLENQEVIAREIFLLLLIKIGIAREIFLLLLIKIGIVREILLLFFVKEGIVREIVLLFLKKKVLLVKSCHFFSYMQFSISAKSFTTTSAPASTRLSRVPLP